jgi:hypothetical protein
MRPIRRLSFYGVRTNEQWIESCIEGVTGESKLTRTLVSLAPLAFQIAIMQVGLDLFRKSFK